MKKTIQLFFVLSIIMSCIACKKTQKDTTAAVKESKNVAPVKPSELFHIPFQSATINSNPTLVLVLHGDAPFNNPSYQYGIAKKIAKENENVVAVGVLRPGYTDNEGNKSKGKKGYATGDNYTKEVLASIHTLTAELKEKYKPSKVILLGHSGGAAIAANLLAQYANVYTDAVLISCPCDLHAWRAHMKKRRPKSKVWDKEVSSLSPIEELKSIDNSAQIMVVHGDKDEIVPLDIANKYVAELEENTKKVNFITLKDKGHEVAFNKRVFDIVKTLIDK